MNLHVQELEKEHEKTVMPRNIQEQNPAKQWHKLPAIADSTFATVDLGNLLHVRWLSRAELSNVICENPEIAIL